MNSLPPVSEQQKETEQNKRKDPLPKIFCKKFTLDSLSERWRVKLAGTLAGDMVRSKVKSYLQKKFLSVRPQRAPVSEYLVPLTLSNWDWLKPGICKGNLSGRNPMRWVSWKLIARNRSEPRIWKPWRWCWIKRGKNYLFSLRDLMDVFSLFWLVHTRVLKL